MSYWFAYRIYDKAIDLEPGKIVLEGPFQNYESAKRRKTEIRRLGLDFLITAVFEAASEGEARARAEVEQF